MPVTTRAADAGETFSTAPVSQKFYTFTPGKLTGKEFWLEDIESKSKIQCREFSFEQFLIYKKPAETVPVRLSLRGGYTSFNILGHTDFQLDTSANVTTGWLPQSSGNFIIYPDDSKEHLPKWTPETTKMIRVPLIKQYGDKVVNAYDIALGLDRVNNGQLKTIDFQLIPITDDSGKKGVRLVPTIPLTDGVYYAYSVPDNIDTDIYGFLFAVGTPAAGLGNSTVAPTQPTAAPTGIQSVDANLARDVLDYALLSQAVYDETASVPNWEKLDAGNCPIDLGLLACSLESAKTGIERDLYGFNAQAYINGKNVVIAFRGTVQRNVIDYANYFADYGNAFLNGKPILYQEALDFAEPLIQKFEKAGLGYKIILTGHSLGGGLASYVALKLGKPAVVFNAAGLGDGLITETKPFDVNSALMVETKLNLNSTSIANIHLVGDPIALCPGNQAGVFSLLTVPPSFVWYDDSGKPIQQFSTIASFLGIDVAYNPFSYWFVNDGKFAVLVGDAKNSKLLYSDYIKLLADHQGLDIRSLPIEPHFMTNIINALKDQAGIK